MSRTIVFARSSVHHPLPGAHQAGGAPACTLTATLRLDAAVSVVEGGERTLAPPPPASLQPSRRRSPSPGLLAAAAQASEAQRFAHSG